MEGPTPRDMANLLPFRKKLNMGGLLHVVLQARMEDQMSGRAVRQDLKQAGFSSDLILANIKKLKKLVESLVWDPDTEGWSDYHACAHVGRDRDTKSDFLATALNRVSPRRVLDIGANDGHFSHDRGCPRAPRSSHSTATRQCSTTYTGGVPEAGSHIVLSDLSNPTPSMGWAGEERPGVVERSRPDMVIAYGVIHHLIYGASIPPLKVLEWLRGLDCSVALEFVSPDDEMVARLVGNKLAQELAHRDRGGRLSGVDGRPFRCPLRAPAPIGHQGAFRPRPQMSLERLGSAPWWTVPLSLATVGAFALAQPLLDLLGKNPEFFIARGLTSLDVIAFPLVLILLPALLAIPVLALRWIGPRTAGLGHAIVIGALFALLTASILVALVGSDTASTPVHLDRCRSRCRVRGSLHPVHPGPNRSQLRLAGPGRLLVLVPWR